MPLTDERRFDLALHKFEWTPGAVDSTDLPAELSGVQQRVDETPSVHLLVTRAHRWWDAVLASSSGRHWFSPGAIEHTMWRPLVGRSRRSVMKTRPIRFKNLDWFVENQDTIFERYAGKWIAIWEEQIVAVAESPEELTREVRSLGLKRVMFTKATPESWGIHE